MPAQPNETAAAALALGVLLTAGILLTGCPGAMLLGMATSDSKAGPRPATAADHEAWTGAPKVQLETHRYFALLPRETRAISDGSEMWILRHCPAKVKSRDECCLHEFVIRDGAVAQYRSVGPCASDCEMRPEPKVKACNDASGKLPVIADDCHPANLCH